MRSGNPRHLGRLTLIATPCVALISVALFVWVDASADLAARTLRDSEIFGASKLIAVAFDTKIWVALGGLATLVGWVLYVPQASPERAHPWLAFAASVIIATPITLAIKIALARYRPIELFEKGRYGFHFLSREHRFNSMPSGHTALAFAGCTAIVLMADRERRAPALLLLLLAAGIGVSRVLVTDHFPSDVLFGAYLGVFSALWGRRLLQWWYDRKVRAG